MKGLNKIVIISFFTFLLFSFIAMKAYSHSKMMIDFKILKSEIEWFINKVKNETSNNGKYTVYVAKISAIKNTGTSCFISISYSEDEVGFSIYPDNFFKYYLQIDDALIVIHINDSFNENFILKNNELLPLYDYSLIYNKFNSNGFALGTNPGYVCNFTEDTIKNKKFYPDSDLIPEDQKIIIYNAEGTLIKLDSNELKKIIENR